MAILQGARTALAAALALGAASLAAPAAAEWNIDAYAGATWENEEHSEAGELTVGGRVGYFFPLVGRLDGGLFLDASGVIDDDKDSTPRDLTFVPTTALGQLRVRLVDADDFGLHPYVGVGPSVVWSKLEVGDEEDTTVDIGLDARAGLRLVFLDRFALFGEYRMNYFENSFDIGQEPEVHADHVWHAALGGIGYRFLPAPAAPPPPAPAPVAAAEPEPAAELPAPTAKRLVLRGVNFEFDRAELSSEATGILDAAVAALGESPDAAVVVAGHTDAIGTEAYNLELSRRRAESVRNYLVDQGLDAARLDVEAYGESRPVADNDTAEGRAQNRRVELEVAD